MEVTLQEAGTGASLTFYSVSIDGLMWRIFLMLAKVIFFAVNHSYKTRTTILNIYHERLPDYFNSSGAAAPEDCQRKQSLITNLLKREVHLWKSL